MREGVRAHLLAWAGGDEVHECAGEVLRVVILVRPDGFAIRIQLRTRVHRPDGREMRRDLFPCRREEEAHGRPCGADPALGEYRDQVVHRPALLDQGGIVRVQAGQVVPRSPVKLEVERDDEGARPIRMAHCPNAPRSVAPGRNRTLAVPSARARRPPDVTAWMVVERGQ